MGSCGCDPLCQRCIDDALAHLRGVAECRGTHWARTVANVIPMSRPWPMTEKMRTIARRKVADISRDERLSERLADHVVAGAVAFWNSSGRQD